MIANEQAVTRHCAQAWRDRPYRETLRLPDGREVLLRGARRSDAPRLQAFFADLSGRSRVLRFHGGVSRLPDSVARTFTTQVRHRHVAIVALSGTHDGVERLVAEARYAVDQELAGRAEFALTVADHWQGQGLGRALLQRLAAHAAMEGFSQLEGRVMDGNAPMLALLRSVGAQVRREPGGVVATLTM